MNQKREYRKRIKELKHRDKKNPESLTIEELRELTDYNFAKADRDWAIAEKCFKATIVLLVLTGILVIARYILMFVLY